MLRVPEDVFRRFKQAMDARDVAPPEQWQFNKRLRYYVDFRGKYGFASMSPVDGSRGHTGLRC